MNWGVFWGTFLGVFTGSFLVQLVWQDQEATTAPAEGWDVHGRD